MSRSICRDAFFSERIFRDAFVGANLEGCICRAHLTWAFVTVHLLEEDNFLLMHRLFCLQRPMLVGEREIFRWRCTESRQIVCVAIIFGLCDGSVFVRALGFPTSILGLPSDRAAPTESPAIESRRQPSVAINEAMRDNRINFAPRCNSTKLAICDDSSQRNYTKSNRCPRTLIQILSCRSVALLIMTAYSSWGLITDMLLQSIIIVYQLRE